MSPCLPPEGRSDVRPLVPFEHGSTPIRKLVLDAIYELRARGLEQWRLAELVGLSGVRLVISDAHAGLKASIRKRFAGSSWQRCRVHFARNLLATIPKAHTEFVDAAFRSIFALTVNGQ
jgi:transposase-like protein